MAGPFIPLSLRRRVQRRANNRCEYCRYPQIACYAQFHCDHFVPASHGGPTSYENLVWACPTCNGSKHGRIRAVDPKTGQMVALFNPRNQRWEEHFAWTSNGVRIRGRTQIGRATVRSLRMNRRGVTLIRAMLVRLGLHPATASAQRD